MFTVLLIVVPGREAAIAMRGTVAHHCVTVFS